MNDSRENTKKIECSPGFEQVENLGGGGRICTLIILKESDLPVK